MYHLTSVTKYVQRRVLLVVTLWRLVLTSLSGTKHRIWRPGLCSLSSSNIYLICKHTDILNITEIVTIIITNNTSDHFLTNITTNINNITIFHTTPIIITTNITVNRHIILTVVLPDSRSKKCEDDVLGRLVFLGEGRPEVILLGVLLPLSLQLLEVVVVLQQLRRVVPDQSEEIVGPGRLQNILNYVVNRDQELDTDTFMLSSASLAAEMGLLWSPGLCLMEVMPQVVTMFSTNVTQNILVLIAVYLTPGSAWQHFALLL